MIVVWIPAGGAVVGVELFTPDRDHRGRFSIGVRGTEVIENSIAAAGLALNLRSGSTGGCLHLA